MPIITNNAIIVDNCAQKIAALEKYVPNKTSIPIDGVVYKAGQLIAIYQSCLDTRAVVNEHRAATKAALAARADAETKRRAIESHLKSWVMNTFGSDSKESHEFGYGPRKAPERKVADKMKAVEQALATRKARNTMGKKQKERVKGSAPTTAVDAPATVTVAVSTPPATNGATAK